ncbi:hypothetical protein CBOS2020_08330 [Clostridium botulinum]|nr:hypothetical protein CBOS2020_08330 [Clostridium botulinum]
MNILIFPKAKLIQAFSKTVHSLIAVLKEQALLTLCSKIVIYQTVILQTHILKGASLLPVNA